MASNWPDFKLEPAETLADSRSPAVLNWQSLLNRCLGNQALAERILGKLPVALIDDLDRLRAAVSASDLDRVRQIAHRTKGTAANAGAEVVCIAATQLEDVAKRCDEAAVVQAMCVLEASVRRVLETIENSAIG